MSASILSTKLKIPKPRPQIVPRDHLISRLDEGLVQSLTLISAPAGFGKTTLASEWARHVDRSVGWVSVDESDNDVIRFLTYFISALQGVREDIGQDELKRLRSHHPPPIEEILISVINQINGLLEDVVFFIDDYHLISTRSIHEAVAYFLDHIPENIHLVIVSRADPPLPLARLRARGEMAEFRQQDLRFTFDEAAIFLRDAMKINIKTDDVRALNSRAEGWVAGLQMAAVSLQDQEDVSDFVRIFTGSNRYILDYLIEEVLLRQPEDIQQFLLHTSILDRLTSSLCDEIVQVSRNWGLDVHDRLQPPMDGFRSQKILEHLENANLFIFPLDDHRQWYRYHRLFRDLLRKHLQQLSPDLIPDLNRRASVWFEQAGMLYDAIEHALSAQDFEHAAQLLERVSEEILMRSEVGTFIRWIGRFPEEILNNYPHLQLFHAWTLILTGAPTNVIERHLRNIGDENGILSARTAAIRAYLAVYQGDLPTAWEISHVAWEQIPEDDFFVRGILSLIFGISLLAKGDIEAGTESLSDIVRTSQEVDNIMLGTITLSHLARLQMRAGDLHEALILYQRAVDQATDKNDHHLPVAGEAYIGLGEVQLQWNDLEKAEEYILKGIQLAETWSEAAALEGYLALARMRQAQARDNEVGPLVEKARKLAVQFEITNLDDMLVEMQKAKLSLLQGGLNEVEQWLKERKVKESLGLDLLIEKAGNFDDHFRKYELIILSRLLIAQGEPRRALDVLIPLLKAMKELHRTDLILEVLVLQAVAHQLNGSLEEAIVNLKEALYLGEFGGYVRLFIDEGTVMANLLYEASRRGISPDYCGKLLGYIAIVDQEDQSQSPLEAEMIEPLTPREIEVLSLIAEGLSNKEIAECLVLSLGTVKVHTRSIYGKLCVNNRTHAVAKAKLIGIL